VVALVVAELIEDGEALPEEAQVYDGPLAPNAEIIEGMEAARRRELVTVGSLDDLMADLHEDDQAYRPVQTDLQAWGWSHLGLQAEATARIDMHDVVSNHKWHR
jgi:hypothetical protein